MFFFDMQHFLWVSLPMFALMFLTQAWVKSAFAKYSQIRNSKGITGAEAAQVILKANGIEDVQVEEVGGFLSDHYSPGEKVLRLSPENYSGTSIAAVGVAAHEAGHALQHAKHYAPLVLRSIAVPMASIGSSLGWLVLFIGMAISYHTLNIVTLIGFGMIACVALFQIVNLPVEFDASRRALQVLPEIGILNQEETAGVRTMLTAAAMTYVAATIAAIAEVLYWAYRLGLIGGRRRD